MSGRARLAALATAALVLCAPGCGSDPPDPEAERAARVLERLELTFSRAQADCIVELLEPETIEALDREQDLEPDTVAMLDYTDALSVCVIDGGQPDEGD